MKQLSAFILSITASATVLAEAQDRGGGDAISAEFVSTAYDIAGRLNRSPLTGVDTAKLVSAILAAKVVSKPSLELDGRPVDAINYPTRLTPLIEVSAKGWLALGVNPAQKRQLVLHEYLAIAGYDDSKYQLSSKLNQIGVCSRSKPVRDALFTYFKVPCSQLSENDVTRVEGRIKLEGSFTKIAADDFANFTNLKEVIFEKAEVAAIAPFAFRDLRNVTHFGSLKDQQISRLEANTFVGLGTYLLDLENNQISTIEQGAFNGLDQLRYLNLSFNKVSEILPGTLLPLKNIEEINLRANRLRTFPFNELASLNPNLRVLDLAYNKLTELPDLAAAGFDKIDRIYLEYNRFRTLPSDAFTQVKPTILFLSGNPFERVSPAAFRGLKLSSLALSGGQLFGGAWPSRAFSESGDFNGAGADLCGVDSANDTSGFRLRPRPLSFIRSAQPNAFEFVFGVSATTLCLDFSNPSLITPASFGGIVTSQLFVFVKNISSVSKQVAQAIDRASNLQYLMVPAADKDKLFAFIRANKDVDLTCERYYEQETLEGLYVGCGSAKLPPSF